MKKLFAYETRLFLRDTDATGVLFVAEQIRMAIEVLERFLLSRDSSLQELLGASLFFPVVHVEADYKAPIFLSDPLQITLFLKTIGQTSVTFFYQFFHLKRQEEVGSVEVVHVAVSQETRLPIDLPFDLKRFIE